MKKKILLIVHGKALGAGALTGVERYATELVHDWSRRALNNDTMFLELKISVCVDRAGALSVVPQKIEEQVIMRKRLWTVIGFSWFVMQQIVLNVVSKTYARIIVFCPAHSLPFFVGGEAVVTIHGLEFEKIPHCYSLAQRWYLRLITLYSVKRATRIICVSKTTRDDVLAYYRAARAKISVIYHGRETEASKTSSSKPQFACSFVGRLEAKKNIFRCMQAFVQGRTEGLIEDSLTMCVAGTPGFGFAPLKLFAERNRRFIDFRPWYQSRFEWEKIIAQSRVMLFVSLYEGFGIPILEYQYRKMPVLLGDQGALPEIGGAGSCLVNPESVNEIKKALILLLNNEKKRKELINNGVANLHRFKTWQEVSHETMHCILRRK